MTDSALQAMYEQMSEAEFQRQVIVWAHRGGWLVHHTHDSRHQEWGTDAGFPDLVLARRGVVIFAELKRERERPSRAQRPWLVALTGGSDGVEVCIWRPSEGLAIRDRLCGPVAA